MKGEYRKRERILKLLRKKLIILESNKNFTHFQFGFAYSIP